MTPRPCNGASSRVLASMRREERDWTLDAVASFLGLGAHTTPLRVLGVVETAAIRAAAVDFVAKGRAAA